MKTKHILFVFLSCLFINSQAAELGVDFGTGIVQTIETDTKSFDSPPNGINVKLWVPVKSMMLVLSSGYGYKKNETNYSHGEERYLLTKGIPVEFEILSCPLQSKTFSPFIGIGMGYYNYELTNKSYATFKYDLKGFAQYFTFGCKYNLTSKVSSFIQFKKLGWSNITITPDDNNFYDYGFTYKSKYDSKNGLEDMGIAMGFSFKI